MKIELVSDLEGHGAPVYDVAFFNQLFYSVSSDKMLASWSGDSNQPNPFSVKAESGIYCFIVSEKQLVIGCSSGNINVIDLLEKKELRNFKIHKKGVYLLHAIQSKDLLISGGGDGVVNFFRASTMELIRSMKVSDKKIRSAYYHQSEQQLYIGCGEGMIRVFELEYYNEIKTFRASDESVNVILRHPLKPLLVSAGKDGHIHFWKEDFSKLRSIAAHNMTIYDLSFNEDHTHCVTVSRDKSIKIWNAESFEMEMKITRKSHKGHTHSVNAVTWINKSEFLTAGDDRILKRWKITE